MWNLESIRAKLVAGEPDADVAVAVDVFGTNAHFSGRQKTTAVAVRDEITVFRCTKAPQHSSAQSHLN